MHVKEAFPQKTYNAPYYDIVGATNYDNQHSQILRATTLHSPCPELLFLQHMFPIAFQNNLEQNDHSLAYL